MVVLPNDEQLGQRSMREWAEDMSESMGVVGAPREEIERRWKEEVLPAILVQDESGRRSISIEYLKSEMFDLLYVRDTARAFLRWMSGGLTDNLTISIEAWKALCVRGTLELSMEVAKRALEARDRGDPVNLSRIAESVIAADFDTGASRLPVEGKAKK